MLPPLQHKTSPFTTILCPLAIMPRRQTPSRSPQEASFLPARFFPSTSAAAWVRRLLRLLLLPRRIRQSTIPPTAIRKRHRQVRAVPTCPWITLPPSSACDAHTRSVERGRKQSTSETRGTLTRPSCTSAPSGRSQRSFIFPRPRAPSRRRSLLTAKRHQNGKGRRRTGLIRGPSLLRACETTVPAAERLAPTLHRGVNLRPMAPRGPTREDPSFSLGWPETFPRHLSGREEYRCIS